MKSIAMRSDSVSRQRKPKDARGRSGLLLACLTGLLASLGLGAGPLQSPSDLRRERAGPLKEAPSILPDRLYVLDTNLLSDESQVLLVDAARGRVLKRFPARHDPDAALSPDGTRLAICSSRTTPAGFPAPLVEVLDTANGRLVGRAPNPEALQALVPHYHIPRLTWSVDGDWIYALRLESKRPFGPYLSRFDVSRGRFLDEQIKLQGRNGGRGVSLPGGGIAMIDEETIDFVNVGAEGVKTTTLRMRSIDALRRRPGAGESIALGIPDIAGRGLEIVTADGWFATLDIQSGKAERSAPIDALPMPGGGLGPDSQPSGWMAGWRVLPQDATVSPDGRRIYLGLSRRVHGQAGYPSRMDRVAVLDRETMAPVRFITPRHPANSLALGRDGGVLYAISPEQSCLMLIEAATGKEIRVLYGVGRTPVWVAAR